MSMDSDLMTTTALSDAELVAKADEVKEAYREVDQDGSVTLSSPGPGAPAAARCGTPCWNCLHPTRIRHCDCSIWLGQSGRMANDGH